MAAYKGNLYVKARTGGPVVNYPFSADDVAQDFVTFDSLNNQGFLNVPTETGGYLVKDLQLRSLGAATTQLLLRKQNKDTDIQWTNGQLNNLTTDVFTRLQGNFDLGLQSGTNFYLRQLA